MNIISLHNIGYKIGDQTILDGLELGFERGEAFVIMGRSGCGKSTLLKLIIGLIQPSTGWIEIDGINTLALSKTQWHGVREKMGMVFQSAALFDSLTVFENVAFGLRRKKIPEQQIRESVEKSLEIVGLDRKIGMMMPADLSGGMKKRVAIARAIAFEPPILLYDEPTTGLDPIMADTINQLILDLKRNLGITSIIVTHDVVSALQIADRIGLLNEGKLVEVTRRDQLNKDTHPLLAQFMTNFL
ncbi:MAG: ATP-binding cassette domain-containing protein [Firmicutes bacterium]|nr:ATP-binding cassette domain-containing protein [Bacillota bacterium]